MAYKKKYTAYILIIALVLALPVGITFIFQHLCKKNLKNVLEPLFSLQVDFQLEHFAFLKSSVKLNNFKLRANSSAEDFLLAKDFILHFDQKSFLFKDFRLRGIEIVEPNLFPKYKSSKPKRQLDQNLLIYYLKDLDKLVETKPVIEKQQLSSFKFLQEQGLYLSSLEPKLDEIFLLLPKVTDLNVHKVKMPELKPGKELEQYQADLDYKKGIFSLVKEQAKTLFDQADKQLKRLKLYIARDALSLKASSDPFSLSDEELNNVLFAPRIEGFLNSLKAFLSLTKENYFEFLKISHNGQEFILDFTKTALDFELPFDFSKVHQYGAKLKFKRFEEAGVTYDDLSYEYNTEKPEDTNLIKSQDVNVDILSGAKQFKLMYKDYPPPDGGKAWFKFSHLFYQSVFKIEGKNLDKAKTLEKVLNEDGRFVLHYEKNLEEEKLSSNFASQLRKTFFAFQTHAAQDLLQLREKEIELFLKDEIDQSNQAFSNFRKLWMDRLSQAEEKFSTEASKITK